MKDFYEVLGISPGAAPADIKKAYFSAVRKYPPDRFQNEFMKIREAYEILSNEKTRQEYDLFVQMAADVRDKIELARQLIDEGDYTHAIRMLEETNEIAPGILIVQSLLGEAYAHNGNNGKAIKIFEKLVKREPENSSFAGQLAHSYLNRGWHKKAIEAFQKALELDADNISLWTGLAQAFFDNHEIRLAKHTLLKALEAGKEKDWGHVTIYFHLIQLDIRMRELSDMDKHLEELTHMAMENRDIRENVGWSLAALAKIMLSNEMFEEAKALVEKCARLLPEDKDIFRMKEEVDNFSLLGEEFEKLEIDDSIREDIVSYIAIDILPEETLDLQSDEKETYRFMFEFKILEEFYLNRSSVEKLKRKYPMLYESKAEFFEKALNNKERKKMLGRYRAESGKYAQRLEAINDSIEDEMDPFGFFDDDEEDDEDFGYDPDFQLQQPYRREEPKIGRNDPCPCGSGKKYKKCCGK